MRSRKEKSQVWGRRKEGLTREAGGEIEQEGHVKVLTSPGERRGEKRGEVDSLCGALEKKRRGEKEAEGKETPTGKGKV